MEIRGQLLVLLIVTLFLAQLALASNGCHAADPDCGGTPFNNCDVRQSTTLNTGSYVVGGGIDICANNISFDCNGSDFIAFDSAITLFNISGVTVANCIFNVSHSAIFLTNSNYNSILNINMQLPGIGHPFQYSSGNFSYGIRGINSFNNLFVGNRANRRAYGFRIEGTNNTFINNTLFNNNLSGIEINEYNRVINNTIVNNEFDGIRMGHFNYLFGNNVSNNKRNGIRLFGVSNVLVQNRACGSNFTIRSTFSDNTGFNNTCDSVFDWNDAEANGCTTVCNPTLPPIQLQLIPNLTFEEDTNITLNLTPYFIDPEGSNLNFTGKSNNVILEFNNLTGTVTMGGIKDFYGSDVINITVQDASYMKTLSFILVNVTPINDPPLLFDIPNRELFLNSTLIIQLEAIDVDNDSLLFLTNASSVLPSSYFFDNRTGLFSWTPMAHDTGIYDVMFTVSDGIFVDNKSARILVRTGLEEVFFTIKKENLIFDWSLSTAYYDGFNHRATLGLLAIPGLPQTDVALNYSFEFNDSITNHGWQSSNPLSVFTSNNQSFEGNRGLKVISTVFQHEFDVVLSNQGRKSCMVWYDDGNNQVPWSLVGFDKVTTNTAGVFMGYLTNHAPCGPTTYCIYSPSPQFWRNSNIIRNIGWHQFCMNAKTVGAPDFTWDTIRVLNSTGGTDLDMISAWNNGATSHIDNVRLSSGYDPNKNILRCKNLITESAFNQINITVQQNLNIGSINYSVSNDNGQHWLPIVPGIPVLFNASSQTLTCDIRFTRGPDGNSSPELTYLRFDPSFVPQFNLQGSPAIGSSINLTLIAAHPNASYIFAMSFNTTPGIDLGDGRTIPLTNDLLLQYTLDPNLASTVVGLQNVQGNLDANGQAQVLWNIPNIPGIANLTVYAAFAVINQSAPTVSQAVLDFSNAIPITLQS